MDGRAKGLMSPPPSSIAGANAYGALGGERCPLPSLTGAADGTHGDQQMSSTFETVSKINLRNLRHPAGEDHARSHAIDDLGIDSLDFLDIASRSTRPSASSCRSRSGRRRSTRQGKTEDYFVLGALCGKIDRAGRRQVGLIRASDSRQDRPAGHLKTGRSLQETRLPCGSRRSR